MTSAMVTMRAHARGRSSGLATRILARAGHALLSMDPFYRFERRVYAALDVATSTSAFGEGFPNAIAEAMACGVPCVVTDVGDSGDIVARPDRVVPPGDAAALAAGWERALDARDEDAAVLRRSIEERYSVARLVERTEAVLAPCPAASS